MGKIPRLKNLPFTCLVCGVDSRPILFFLVFFMGSLVLASLSFLAWALITGRFKNIEKLANIPIEREQEEWKL